MATQDNSSRFESGGSYVENSLFAAILGDDVRAKLLTALLGKRDMELSVSELQDLTGSDPTWLRKNLEELVAYGIVRETRIVGNAQLYQLDPEHPVALALYDLYEAVLENAEDMRSTASA